MDTVTMLDAILNKMLGNLTARLIRIITDWLFVLMGVSLCLWFVMRLPVFDTASATSNSLPIVNQEKLKTHVQSLVDYYAPRTIEYGNLNITARYIRTELSRFGNVQYQPYWTLAGRFSNVILTLGPETKEVLVFGAHYDAESNSLDIDGNASGVASLIELARLLAKNENKLPIQVAIVVYPLSQKNSVPVENMGSYQHAALLKSQNKDVRLMVSLDGVGRFNASKNSQHYPYQFMQLFYPNNGNYIGLIGRVQDILKIQKLKKSIVRASSLPIYSFNVAQNNMPVSSYDHINYQKFGYPAVLLSDTAHLRDQKQDTGDIVEKLDYDKMSMLIRGLYQSVMDAKPAKATIRLVRQKDLDANKLDVLQ